MFKSLDVGGWVSSNKQYRASFFAQPDDAIFNRIN